MLTNAQLDNEKAGLKFELENIKDDMEETEEKHISLVKEHRRKCTVSHLVCDLRLFTLVIDCFLLSLIPLVNCRNLNF